MDLLRLAVELMESYTDDEVIEMLALECDGCDEEELWEIIEAAKVAQA